MTIYDVHIYREMRLYFAGIDAGTTEEAAQIAADRLTSEAEYVEDCDGENLAALVDVAGDEEFTQSVPIDFEPERLRKLARQLLEVLKTLAEQADEDCPAEYRSRHLVQALEDAYTFIAKVQAQLSDRRQP